MVRWQIRFSFTYDRKFETFQTLGNENGPDVTITYHCGLGIGAIQYGVAAVWVPICTTLSARPLALGEGTITVLRRRTEPAEFILREKVQLYNSIKNLSTLAGRCEADVAIGRLVDLPRVWCVVRN